MSDDEYERPKGKSVWRRIRGSKSYDRGELPSEVTPIRKSKKKRRGDRSGESEDFSNETGTDRDQEDSERKKNPFRRRHTATLGISTSNNTQKSSIFSLKRKGWKTKHKKTPRESGCKSDGDSVDLASDCSSVGVGVPVPSSLSKKVAFVSPTKSRAFDQHQASRRQRNVEHHKHTTIDIRGPVHDGKIEEEEDFFEAHTGDFQPESSFDSLPAAPPTIDSLPLCKHSVSFDSAPPQGGYQYENSDIFGNENKDNYGYGDMGPSRSDAEQRPRAASDFNAYGTQHNTTRRARGERARYSVYQGNSGIKKKFRVRPYHCFPDGTQMTEEEIYLDSMKPSQKFYEIESYLAPSCSATKTMDVPDTIRKRWGSPNEDGRIGSLRVEILGCIGLSRTKPDVSVYAICGDAAFCTDVVSGYRSPMWPAIARRACIFPIHHAYAKLYLGIFDCRVRKVKENDCFCGRVAIDLGALRPNTEYDTTLPLRASTFVYDKRRRGVVRVRMSLHWFDERSAVLSYFPRVRSLVDSAPLLEGQPTIPCADPKTFRNVAITVYGQDLPGKYSKSAFKATIREFNLYQQNCNYFLRTFFFNIMLYERPILSLYWLGASIYCVYFNCVRMVPAFFVGFLILSLMRSYFSFVEDSCHHLGYKPVTFREVLLALVSRPDQKSGRQQALFESLSVDKKTKRRRGGAPHRFARMNSRDETESKNQSTNETDDDEELKGVDHREFPFSDRDAYPKFSVEEALANPGGAARLHGRLSIYYSTPVGEDDDEGDGSSRASETDNDDDDETVTESMGDSIYDLDSDAEEDDEMQAVGADHNYKRAMMSQTGETRTSQRVRLGPPQDSDVIGGKKIPPQLQLKKVENLLYKTSMRLSVERVHAPPSKSDEGEAFDRGDISPDLPLHLQKKIKKNQMDDFDKLLGLKSRSANPVNRIMGSFMGPLMRMIRVPIYLARVMFHITTWRDPYLTFWVFLFLVCLFFVLIFFPWRLFFFGTSIVCLGPQNILVRRYLETRAVRKAIKAMEDEEEAEAAADRRKAMQRQPSARFRRGKSDLSMESSNNSTDTRSKDRRGLFVKRKHKRSDKTGVTRLERPPFSSDLHGSSASGKKLAPRAVAIPYGRLKKDRFFDWPPDPTVSRATALENIEAETDEAVSLTSTLPDAGVTSTEGLRQRKNATPVTIPSNITF